MNIVEKTSKLVTPASEQAAFPPGSICRWLPSLFSNIEFVAVPLCLSLPTSCAGARLGASAAPRSEHSVPACLTSAWYFLSVFASLFPSLPPLPLPSAFSCMSAMNSQVRV